MLKNFKFSYIAPAKINIFLKIIDKNKNFHNLVSLIGFTEFGDRLNFSRSNKDAVLFTGPFSKNLDPKDNLIVKAKIFSQLKSKFRKIFLLEVVLEEEVQMLLVF